MEAMIFHLFHQILLILTLLCVWEGSWKIGWCTLFSIPFIFPNRQKALANVKLKIEFQYHCLCFLVTDDRTLVECEGDFIINQFCGCCFYYFYYASNTLNST